MKFQKKMLKNGWCEARENWLKMIREFPEEQFIKADDFKNQSVSFGLRDTLTKTRWSRDRKSLVPIRTDRFPTLGGSLAKVFMVFGIINLR